MGAENNAGNGATVWFSVPVSRDSGGRLDPLPAADLTDVDTALAGC